MKPPGYHILPIILADEKVRLDDVRKSRNTKVDIAVAMFVIILKSYQTFWKTDFYLLEFCQF